MEKGKKERRTFYAFTDMALDSRIEKTWPVTKNDIARECAFIEIRAQHHTKKTLSRMIQTLPDDLMLSARLLKRITQCLMLPDRGGSGGKRNLIRERQEAEIAGTIRAFYDSIGGKGHAKKAEDTITGIINNCYNEDYSDLHTKITDRLKNNPYRSRAERDFFNDSGEIVLFTKVERKKMQPPQTFNDYKKWLESLEKKFEKAFMKAVGNQK